MTNRSKGLAAAAFVALAAGYATSAFAGSITYTESGDVQYTINGGSIQGGPDGALLTITETANTSTVLNASPDFENQGTVTFTIAGLGGGTFTDSMAVIDETGLNTVGFSDISDLGPFVLTTTNSAFSSYQLATAIGPVTSTAGTDTGVPFPSTIGSLEINTTVGQTTFTATTGGSSPPTNTPEPASLGVLLTGLAGLYKVRRARNAARASGT